MTYLYLGDNELVRADSVIGVFDLDHCAYDRRARQYLQRAQADGLVIDAFGQIPRSFIVCTPPYQTQVVRLSPLSASAVVRRPQPWDND